MYFYYLTLHNARLAKHAEIQRDLAFFREGVFADLASVEPEKGMLTCRFGMNGNIIQGHVDSGMNMIAMIRGSKRYILAPPSVCRCLYLLSKGGSARHTELDWGDLDMESEKGQIAAACPSTEVVLQPGDILYVPMLWYHHIVSLEESIQCNFRTEHPIHPLHRIYRRECAGN